MTVRVGVLRVGARRVGVLRTGGEKDRVRVGVDRTDELRGGLLVLALLLLVAPRRWLRRSSVNRPRARGRAMRIAVLCFMGRPLVGDAGMYGKSNTVGVDDLKYYYYGL